MKIHVHQIGLSFYKKQILTSIQFDIKQGEIIGIIGPNGAGKTSLMKVIAGLIKPSTGSITLHTDHKEVNQTNASSHLPSSKKTPFFYINSAKNVSLAQKKEYHCLTKQKEKNNISIIPDFSIHSFIKKPEILNSIIQYLKQVNPSFFNLFNFVRFYHPLSKLTFKQRAKLISYLPQNPNVFWPVSVKHIIALGRSPYQSNLNHLSKEDHLTIEQAMQFVGISKFADRNFQTLSGGEQIRVHLARIFASKTPFLLLDEPITNLDPHYQSQVMQTIKKQSNKGIVMILHDLAHAFHYCDRLLVIHQGELIANTIPSEIPKYLIEEIYQIRFKKNQNGMLIYEHF